MENLLRNGVHSGESASVGSDIVPPQNVEAERCVLGSMLRDNDVIESVIGIVNADSFYLDAHQKIFRAIVDLRNRSGQPVDAVLLAEELMSRNQLEEIGRGVYLGQLWEAAPTAANAEYYAQIIRGKSIVRRCIHAGHQIIHLACDPGQTADELLEEAERAIFGLRQVEVTSHTMFLGDLLVESVRYIEKISSQRGGLTGLATGFTDIDCLTGGLQNGELVVVGARPSVGKTSFGLIVARNVVRRGVAVFFASLEQSSSELALRLLCSEANVNSMHIRLGRIGDGETRNLAEAMQTLRTMPLHIDDYAHQSVQRIAANARRLRRKYNIGLIIVDYIQLIEPENRRDSRVEQVGKISRYLKGIARELNIPLLSLAQVNRAAEDRSHQKPRLCDLRESGSLEADADTVLLMHRPNEREPGQAIDTVEIEIAKQRNGPTGTVTLAYRKEYMRFEDYADAAYTPFD